MVQWNTNSSGNGIWACLNLGNGKDAMLSVYRCIVTNNYIQMVWIEGSDSRYSKSEHACCISAMVHAEAAASNLLDEIAAKSAIWQEV
ncbi:hypothetical protein EBT25_18090 [bacterium]|jgi:hypothetical protein|nr:hypothetical protein [bacterium]